MGKNKELDNRLIQLAASGHVEAARLVIKEGADPQARNPEGKTGLHYAIDYSEYTYTSKGREMLALFLNRDVDINSGDNNGATALHYAALDEGYPCRYKIEDLLNFGANLEARDRQGQTPLHHACRRGKKTDAVKALLEAGAEINARDEAGATPLHMAAARGDAEVIAILLKSGADVHAQTRDGRTVWDFGVEAGQDYQAQCLKAEAAKQIRLAHKKQREEELKRCEQMKPKDPWSLLGPEKVAVASIDRRIGYKLTEVFNFSARTYTQISQNLSTNSEAIAVKTFDEFDDKTSIERAFSHLERLGGHADRAAIHGPVVEKPRKGLAPPKM